MIASRRKQKNSASAVKQPSHSRSTSQQTDNNMVHSVAKGVAKLNLCLPSTSSSQPTVDFYYVEIGNDDGSCTTETATSHSSLSPSSPSPCCQAQSSVRLPPFKEMETALRVGTCAGGDWGLLSSVVGGALDQKKQEQKTHQKSLFFSLQKDKQQLELKKQWEERQRQQEKNEPASVSSSTTAGTTISDAPSIKRQEEESSRSNGDNCRDMNENGIGISISVEEEEEYEGAYDGVHVEQEDEVSFGPQKHPSSEKVNIHYPKQVEDYEDPPLSAQTSYARQQLLKSSRYMELQRQAKAQRKAAKAQEDDEDDDSLDSDDYYCVDEVDISRGLGGYEEGFAVPSLGSCHHGYHHLPVSTKEEQDGISLASSVADDTSIMDDVDDAIVAAANKDGSLGNTEEETMTIAETHLGGSRYEV